MYLLDSGAQYLDGTTDITRTIHLGEPSPKQRRQGVAQVRGNPTPWGGSVGQRLLPILHLRIDDLESP